MKITSEDANFRIQILDRKNKKSKCFSVYSKSKIKLKQLFPKIENYIIHARDTNFRIQIIDLKNNESKSFSIYEKISLNELIVKLMRFVETLK